MSYGQSGMIVCIAIDIEALRAMGERVGWKGKKVRKVERGNIEYRMSNAEWGMSKGLTRDFFNRKGHKVSQCFFGWWSVVKDGDKV